MEQWEIDLNRHLSETVDFEEEDFFDKELEEEEWRKIHKNIKI